MSTSTRRKSRRTRARCGTRRAHRAPARGADEDETESDRGSESLLQRRIRCTFQRAGRLQRKRGNTATGRTENRTLPHMKEQKKATAKYRIISPRRLRKKVESDSCRRGPMTARFSWNQRDTRGHR